MAHTNMRGRDFIQGKEKVPQGQITMKFRQLIATNPFQKSRDKKKKKSEAQPQIQKSSNFDRQQDNPSDVNNKHGTEIYVYEQSFERPQFRLGTNSAYINGHFDFSNDDYVQGVTFSGGEDSGLLTAPRERSRIRTNPWIRQPADRQSDFSETDISDSEGKQFIPQSYLSFERREAEIKFAHIRNTASESVKLRSKSDKPDTEDKYRWSIISEGDISIDLDSQTIDSLSEQFKSLQHSCSFEYEDNLDSVLENGFRREVYLSVQDLLSESSETADSSSSSDVSMESATDDCARSDVMNTSSESESTFDDTLKCQGDGSDVSFIDENENIRTNTSPMEESLDAGYSSLSRDRRSSADSMTSSSTSDGSVYSSFISETEGVSSCSDLIGDERSSTRTLSEVRISLQEKVEQLRLEKFLVQQKVREAREEERFRQEERKKFKSQLMSQRKHALFKTLNDLKERLENQSVRLQRSYSTVLTMQRRFARRRATFHCSVPS